MRTWSLVAIACLMLSPRAFAVGPLASLDEPLPPGAIARLGYARMIGKIWFVVVSPRGNWAFCGTWFDLATGKEIPPPVHIPDRAYPTHCFADGSYIVHGNQDNQLFSPGATEPRLRFPFNEGYTTFDRAGKFCLQVLEGEKETGGEVALIDLRKGDLKKGRRILTTTRNAPYNGALSENGTCAAWFEAERADDGKVRLCVCHLASGKTVKTDLHPTARYGALVLSPDGKTVVVQDNKNLTFFRTDSGKPTRTIADLPGENRPAPLFSPDGKTLAVSTIAGTALVPQDERQPIRLFPFHLAAFLPDGRRGVTRGPALVLAIHDLETGKQLDAFSRFPAFDGVRMIGEHTAASWNSSGFLVSWDVRTARVLSKTRIQAKDRFALFRTMRFSPDGRHVAAWSEGKPYACVLAETATGKILQEVGSSEQVCRAFFQPFRSEAALYDPERNAYRSVQLLSGNWAKTWPPLGTSEVQLAMRKDPVQTVKLMATKLSPAIEVPPAKIAAWVRDLDSDQFAQRQAAEQALAMARDQAELALQRVMDKPASVEQLRRAERLLKRIDPATDFESLRHSRAIEILESIGSPDALALLRKLAQGAAAARLTRPAKESVMWLEASAASPPGRTQR